MSSNKIEPEIDNKVDQAEEKVAEEKVQVRGVKAVLDQALQSYEKLPMLEIVFEKFITQLATSLRNLTSEAVDVEISEFNSLRFGSFFSSLKTSFSIAVFKAVEWENLGLLILENELIFSLVDLLLGGKKNIASQGKTTTSRVLTSIEQGLAKQIVEVILSDLSTSFDAVSPTSFVFERLESNPNFATISRPGDAIIVLKLKIVIDKKIEKIELVIPYKTIEPVKEQMQQVFLGDKFGSDAAWEELLLSALYQVDVPIEAVIINKPSTLEEVAGLRIGDTIIMDQKQDDDVLVRFGQVTIYRGQIGKIDNKIAVSLKSLIQD